MDEYRPIDKVHSAIQLAAFHYIVCLKANPSNLDHKIRIDRTEYVFGNIERADNLTLRAEFQAWASTTVLRDLIESFSFFLTEIYTNAVRENPNLTFSATVAQFERKGIEDQLKVFSSDFIVDQPWIERLIGYNRARNCLAHREGIVGARDVTHGNDLVICWLMGGIEVVGGPVTPFVEVAGPMGSLIGARHLHGSAARIEMLHAEKRIHLGESLFLLPNEVLGICQTLQMVSSLFCSVLPRG